MPTIEDDYEVYFPGSEITVTGLESDLYYINNPILINILGIDTRTIYLDLTVSNLNDANNIKVSNPLRIYPNIHNQIVDFDISEVIKANFPRPKHPTTSLGNGTPIGTNYVRFAVNIQQRLDNGHDGLPYSSTKTFLRGGKDTQAINVTANMNQSLSINNTTLIWGGLPVNRYYIDNNKQIAISNIIPTNEVVQMKSIGCDPFYVRFLNNLGGYSYWYFPIWEKEKKTKSAGYVNRVRISNGFSLGFEATHTLKAESKIKRDYFDLAEALISSPEIHAYNKYGNTWAKIELKDGSFSRNTYEDVSDFNVQFNVKLTNDERLIW